MERMWQLFKDLALIFLMAVIFALLLVNVAIYGYSDITNDYRLFQRAIPLPEKYLSYFEASPIVGILEPEREVNVRLPWPEPEYELNYSSGFWYWLELNRGPKGEDLDVIKEAIILPDKKVIWIEAWTGQRYQVNIPSDERATLLYNLRTHRVTFQEIKSSLRTRATSFIGSFLLDNLPLFLFMPVVLVFFGLAGKRFFTAAVKAQVKWRKRPKERFSDLGGLPEAVAQGELIKDFLRNPKKYLEIGAMPIKGVILHGPPGTGKTLFAKALAGELGIPFLSISGSEFQSMFPGLAPGRVKSIFIEAQKFEQSIIFMDEIDAIGRKRGTGQPTDQEEVLTAILTMMQGIDDESTAIQKQIEAFRKRFPDQELPRVIRKKLSHRVIIVAATNRYDVLDPALVREGRFDIDLVIPLPDIEGRLEILEIHSRNKVLSPETDLLEISKITPGFSGAALSDLMNKAAILAAKSGKKEITMIEIEQARESVAARRKTGNSSERISILSSEERWRLAVHQAGHSLLRKLLMGDQALIPVSIIFGRKGYQQTFSVEELYSQKAIWLDRELYGLLAVAFGGIIAERVIFPEASRSTLGEEDIKMAAELVHKIVKEWRMAPEINVAHSEIEIIKDEIMTQKEERAAEICRANRALIEECARILIAKETLDLPDLIEVFENAANPNPDHKAPK